MISGAVDDNLEAVITLDVLGTSGKHLRLSTVIDTGFNGWLTLPSEIVEQLGLIWLREVDVTLADGQVELLDEYRAMVSWNGQARNVVVLKADSTPLLGMLLLRGHVLKIEVDKAGAVAIWKIGDEQVN